jgi:flagellar assembly factor FliW
MMTHPSKTQRKGVQEVNSKRTIFGKFGHIEIDLAKIIHFPTGVIGMPDIRDFCLASLNDEVMKNFTVLQAIDDEGLTFLCLPIDHGVAYDNDDILAACEFLNIALEDLIVIAIASTKNVEDKQRIVLNLRAPLLIDTTHMLGTQYVLPNTKYSIQHPL